MAGVCGVRREKRRRGGESVVVPLGFSGDEPEALPAPRGKGLFSTILTARVSSSSDELLSSFSADAAAARRS